MKNEEKSIEYWGKTAGNKKRLVKFLFFVHYQTLIEKQRANGGTIAVIKKKNTM
jgi:hypothetical protein